MSKLYNILVNSFTNFIKDKPESFQFTNNNKAKFKVDNSYLKNFYTHVGYLL